MAVKYRVAGRGTVSGFYVTESRRGRYNAIGGEQNVDGRGGMMGTRTKGHWGYWGMGLAALLVVGAIGGCGGAKRQAREISESNLKPLAILYGQYISQHRGQPPGNEAQFKAFIKSLPPARLAALTENRDADGLFLSPRDGKPYVVLYGRSKGAADPGAARVVAYEQEGSGGKRLVANSMGAIDEVDETAFRQMVPSATGP